MAIMEEENPIRFGILMALGLSLLPQLGLGLMIALLPDDPPMLPLMGISQIVLMLLPTLLVARTQSLPRRELFRLKNPGWIGFAFLALGLLSLWPLLQCYLLFQELYLLPTWLLEEPQKYRELLQDLFGSPDAPAVAAAVLIGAVTPGVGEELLFRGLAMRSFQDRLPPATSIALAAIIFAAVHLSPIHFLPLLALGAFFGLLTVVTDSIYPAMLGHAIFNSVSIIALVAGGQPEDFTHTVDDLLMLLPVAAISLVAFIWTVQWMVRYGRRIEGEEVI
jgi:membrane protease YdiL (CAAX protease family)